MSVATVRAGLAEALKGNGFNVYSSAVGDPETPALVVGNPTITGLTQEWPIAVVFGMADSEAAQASIDAFYDGPVISSLLAPSSAWRDLVIVSQGEVSINETECSAIVRIELLP
jgi:hypothetical protein